MQFSLKASDGIVIKPYQKNRKQFIQIAGMEYEVYNSIDDFDFDPEIKLMIEDSEKDIEQNRIYSTEQMIEAIERGEL